jgi:hypothetical protein
LRRAALAALLLQAPEPALADCGGLQPLQPTVTVTTSEPAEPRLVAATTAEIRSRAARSGSGLPAGAMARGLTVDDVAAEARTTLSAVTSGQGRCVALQAIDGTVRSRAVEVLIDRDYRPGSCQYRVVLEHEREHVRINAGALARLGELLAQRLRELADRWAGRWLPAGGEAGLEEELGRALEEATRQARGEAEERHRAIDTAEAYAAVQARCERW